MVIGLPSIASYIASKSPCCIGEQFSQSFFSLFNGVRADHFTDRRNSVSFKEHVLGTAQADSFCAKCTGLFCITRIISIGSDFQSSVFVSPSHDVCRIRR